MEKWLVLSNCQTFGLAASFSLLNPNFDAEAVDIWSYKNNPDKFDQRMKDFFRIVAHPHFLDDPNFPADRAPNLSIIPSIYFGGYHPDCCYAYDGAGQVNGPLHAYHSMIVLAAFKNQVPLERVKSFFNGQFYEDAGYFDVWSNDRDHFLATFSQYGLDMRDHFNRWSGNGPFMHTLNHPSIMCVYDIAKEFMQIHGVEVFETHIRPHDNLLQGPVFPVYPEIGEALGLGGSYLFKLASVYRYIDLDAFITQSYKLYKARDRESLWANFEIADRFSRVLMLTR